MNLFNIIQSWLKRRVNSRGVSSLIRGHLDKSDAAQIAALIENLYGSTSDLEQVSKSLENLFLNTSNELERLALCGNDFVKQSEKLVNVATGKSDESSTYIEAVEVMKAPLDFLCECHSQTLEILQHLKRDNQCITELFQAQSELERGMAPLKFIQTLFKVESATQDSEVQMMFGALTKEIEALHSKMTEMFSTKFIELRQIQVTLTHVISLLEVQAKVLDEVVTREKADIETSLMQLKQDLSNNQKKESTISRLSRQIADEIQKAVIGMQFQDIVNQKLQHTVQALTRIREKSDLSVQSRRFIEQSCRLESEQLLEVCRDLATAESTTKKAVQNVLARLEEANAQCLSLGEFERLTTSADGMLQLLLDVFANLRKQITSTVSNCSSAYETLKPIGGLASDMTTVVRTLSIQIHLIGLNAQIQAALLEEGVGLEVLSARTSEISRETNLTSDTVATQLNILIGSLSKSLKSLETLYNSAKSHQEILDQSGMQMERRLHGMRDQALTAMNSINDLLENIRVQGEKSVATIHYAETGSTVLASVQEKLGALSAMIGEDLPAADAGSHVLVEDLKGAYTMSSEREIFDRVVAGKTSKTRTANPGLSETETSVELFGPSGSVPASSPPTGALKEQAKANTPEPVKKALPVEEKKSAETDMGNNVELF